MPGPPPATGSSTAATTPGRPIVKVFAAMVNDFVEAMDKTKHEFAVDVELNFKSVTIDQKGIPLFTKTTTQSQMEIKIATRLTPSVKKQEPGST